MNTTATGMRGIRIALTEESWKLVQLSLGKLATGKAMKLQSYIKGKVDEAKKGA